MAKPELKKAEPKVVIRMGPYFKESFKKHQAAVQSKLNDFMQLKLRDPLAKFGSKDEHFTGDGPLKETGVIHAHLTGDISILYKRLGRDPTFVDLYAIATHDELGTGQPPSNKLQKNMAKLLNKQTFN